MSNNRVFTKKKKIKLHEFSYDIPHIDRTKLSPLKIPKKKENQFSKKKKARFFGALERGKLRMGKSAS